MSNQLIHYKVTELNTNKYFYLRVIYGMNYELQREEPWSDLMDISQSMDAAWCLMGDFNTILSEEDRKGGNEVQDHELRELASLLQTGELHELSSTGAYYSWTNKTIWSRIDHVFLNDYEYDFFIIHTHITCPIVS